MGGRENHVLRDETSAATGRLNKEGVLSLACILSTNNTRLPLMWHTMVTKVELASIADLGVLVLGLEGVHGTRSLKEAGNHKAGEEKLHLGN